MSIFPRAAVAFFVLASAGCAFNASPADGLQFRAPAGWRPSPGIMGLMQFWRPPSGDREMLMLIKSPTPLKESDIFSNPQMNDSVKNATVEAHRRIVICGRQPAQLIEARGTSSGRESRFDMVMSNVAGSTYIAMYARPVGAASDPAALAALRELCAKP